MHHDLKPANILVCDDGTLTVKIVDFGVSEYFKESESAETLKSVGSPAFFAPEITIPHHELIKGKPCDIWAMGCTLYFMIFGTLPFPSCDILELYIEIKQKQPSYKDIPSNLVEMFKGLLDKDPNTRFTIDHVRNSSWVTGDFSIELISKRDNCGTLVSEEVTQEELSDAVGVAYRLSKAVKKFRDLLKN